MTTTTRHIVTANRLDDGRVVVRAAGGWSTVARHALSFATAEDANAEVDRARSETTHVVGPVAVEVDAAGMPVLGRERIRLCGPTVPLPVPVSTTARPEA